MSDDTTPRAESEQPEQPQQPQQPVAAEPVTKPAATQSRPTNQVWLLIVAAALLVGCFVGASAMAVGSFVASHVFHGRDRVSVQPDRKGDHRRQPPPIRKQPAPPRLPGAPGMPKVPPPTTAPTAAPTPST